MKAICIQVTDHHEVARQRMRAFLEVRPEWEICAEAANGREADERAIQAKLNVVQNETQS